MSNFNIGLYFGSFNPIHIGHLIIANHILEHTNLDKIWFVVSPQNPLKPSKTLLNEYDRLHLVNLAIESNPNFKASNIEFNLPKPSYTIDTLTYLNEKFPHDTFTIIMGSDSIQNIEKWKNYDVLMKNYDIVVYNRPGFDVDITKYARAKSLSAPHLDISATHIRNSIKNNKSIKYLVPEEVRVYIEANRYYK
jgi:nicotinate-nucleotide adenylyltransferase